METGNLLFIVTMKDVLILLLGAVLSWVLAKYYYSKSISKPHYRIRSDYISSKEFAKTGISIKYDSTIIDNLTISRVALWNKGNSILKSNIAENDPIAIKINNGGFILENQVLYSKNENNLQVEKEKDKIVLKFDFLARNQGFVIKVFHTGNANDLEVCGSFVDGKKLSDNGEAFSRKMLPQTNKKTIMFRRIMHRVNLLIITLSLVSILFLLYFSIFDFNNDKFQAIVNPIKSQPNPSNDVFIRIYLIVMCILFFVVFSFMFYKAIRFVLFGMPKEVEHQFYGNYLKSDYSSTNASVAADL